MKKFITMLMAGVMMFNTTALASEGNYDKVDKLMINNYTTLHQSEEVDLSKPVIVELQPEVFEFNGKTQTYYTFQCGGIKFVPLRKLADFMGKNIEYNPTEKAVYISDSAVDSTENEQENEKPTEEIAKLSYVPVFYGETNKKISYENKVFNVDGNVYVPLKNLILPLGYVRQYKEKSVKIFKLSDRLKFTPNPENYEEVQTIQHLSDDSEIAKSIDINLVIEALAAESSRVDEPFKSEQRYSFMYYKGKLCICVISEYLDYSTWLVGGLYEIVY